jgi:hypothetical protein
MALRLAGTLRPVMRPRATLVWVPPPVRPQASEVLHQPMDRTGVMVVRPAKAATATPLDQTA